MPGVEPILVISLISSAIKILDSITKIYNDIEDAEGLPEAFLEVTQRVPLVQDTLRTAEVRIKDCNLDEESCTPMKLAVEDCIDKGARLEKIFQRVAPQPHISRFNRYRAVVHTLGNRNLVEALMEGILKDVQLLVGNRAIMAATEAEVGKLAKAREELSAIPPSLLEDISGNSINNYGSDTPNVNRRCLF